MKKPNWIKDIKAIGWDLDGTLYPPDAIPVGLVHDLMIQKVMTKQDWRKEEAEAEFARIKKELGSSTSTLTRLGVEGDSFFRNLWQDLPLQDYIKPDPKLVEMFGKLKHFPHLMISNSNVIAMIEKKLSLLGLDPAVFCVMISTDEVGVTKPDPKPFTMTMARLNRLYPEIEIGQVLYVGDRVETDIVGAKGVGMKTCLVRSESGEADICLNEVYEVADLFEVRKI